MPTKTEKATYTWELTAYQSQGRLWLKWNIHNIRPQQGQIHVYKNRAFPGNPQDDTEKWCWDDEHNRDWDTGLEAGSDWHCAYIAERPKDYPCSHKYDYMIKLITE